MSIFDFKRKEVVRIKVKLCNGEQEDLYKKFSVDPHITSFEVMQRIIARAFNINTEFNISYLATDDYGEQFYLPMLSDWDLDAAIFTASDPVLRMKIELRPRESGLEEWDIVVPGEIPSMQRATRPHTSMTSRNNSFTSFTLISQLLSNQMEKTVHSVQKALGGMKLGESMAENGSGGVNWKPSKQPMGDAEFKNFMDNIGRLVMPREFKHSVYLGGLEPSLRKVGWRLLLDVYPLGLTGQERLSFLRQQSQQYTRMKNQWKEAYAAGNLSEQQVNLIAGISVDVVRTDRTHSFYASEGKENSKISQLFDLLATFSLYHPSVGYSQGMSDLASPLLYVQAGDEGAAYVCFCALMRRLKWNFSANGQALITKLQHFHDMVVYYDSALADFLRQRGMADMFFAHRWLLLELKREFRFEDCLRILEVQWAALPPTKNNNDSSMSSDGQNSFYWNLMENGLSTEIFTSSSSNNNTSSTNPPEPQKHNSYVRLQALRRASHTTTTADEETSTTTTSSSSSSSSANNNTTAAVNNNFSGHASHDFQLMNSLVGEKFPSQPIPIPVVPTSSSLSRQQLHQQNEAEVIVEEDTADDDEDEDDNVIESTNHNENHPSTSSSFSNNKPIRKRTATNSSSSSSMGHHLLQQDGAGNGVGVNVGGGGGMGHSVPGHGLIVIKDGVVELPPPSEMGFGNPFLLFLCLSFLLEYRESLIRNVHEMFDFAQFFRRQNQNHNVNRILGRARHMFDEYIRDQETRRKELDDYPELLVSL